MIDVNSIVSALRHRKIAACVIIAEIAVAFAILSNAVFLIVAQVERVTMSSGTAERQILVLSVTPVPGGDVTSADATTREDLRALAGIAGVKVVSALNQLPYGGGEILDGIELNPEQQVGNLVAAVYIGDESALETLGAQLVAGRGFRTDEVAPFAPDVTPPVAILTSAAAQRLFGRSGAVGRVIYLDVGRGKMTPVTVVGVVKRLVRPILAPADGSQQAYSVIVPEQLTYATSPYYVIRTTPAEMARVAREAKEVLARSNPARQVVWVRPLTEVKSRYFRQERSMTWILVAVCAALLVVTAAGIFGLTSVWMRERVHQIGIRRALGATRGQILIHYMFENIPLAMGGVVVGAGLAFAASGFLRVHGYSLSRLQWPCVAVGAASLLALNQLAVFTPARRAATIAPAEAARL